MNASGKSSSVMKSTSTDSSRMDVISCSRALGRTSLLLAVWLSAALVSGCDDDPRYGPDGQLLEACDVTDEEEARWAACRAADEAGACGDNGGSWQTDEGVEFFCYCPPPTSGCPCRDAADCAFGSCISDDRGDDCGQGLGTCETPESCWCDVEAGTEICV